MGRNLALIGSIGSLLFALLVAALNGRAIAHSFEEQPFVTGVIAVVMGVLALWQIMLILRLLKGADEAPQQLRASAVVNWAIFVVVMVVFAMWDKTPEWYGPFVTAWGAGWFVSEPVAIRDFHFTLLPLFLLLQWWGAASMSGSGSNERWSGAAVGAIGYCAVLGVIAARTLWSGGVAGTDDAAVQWFFVIGTALHIIAIWRILASCAFDWMWAGLIGWGCLISGWYLAHIAHKAPDAPRLTGPSGTGSAEIGSILYMGWYGIAPYMPILAYAIVAIASLKLRGDETVHVSTHAMAG